MGYLSLPNTFESLDSYKTISKKSEGFYKEKGSKFISIAFPARNIKEVEDALKELRKEFYDARHHCYAYIIGNAGESYRANDDGEPNHSAGDPILGQIRSNELTNTLIVVVRYFGGTKLGVSGLINAYKTAAKDALQNNNIVEEEITRDLEIRFKYEDTNEVMNLINTFAIKIIEQDYQENCKIMGAVNTGTIKALEQKVQTMKQMGTDVSLSISPMN